MSTDSAGNAGTGTLASRFVESPVGASDSQAAEKLDALEQRAADDSELAALAAVLKVPAVRDVVLGTLAGSFYQ